VAKKKVGEGVEAEPVDVTEKHAGGRPPKYATPEELQAVIEGYFESCWFEQVTESTDEKTGKTEMSSVRYQQRPYTIAGLAYHLEMTTQALRDYQSKDEFLCIIKRAKQKIEMNFEENLHGKNPTGSIFWLKNHAGYKDKTETDVNHKGEIVHKIERTIVKPA
jgi:hypothetical protein